MTVSLKTELEKLAQTVVAGCQSSTTELALQIDALKTLTAVYVALQKHPGEEEPDDTEFNFDKGIKRRA